MMRNEEIFAAVRASLEGRTVKNALLIPPDFTRFHSNAGLIAGEYYRLLTERGAQVDVLPALGTHRRRPRLPHGRHAGAGHPHARDPGAVGEDVRRHSL